MFLKTADACTVCPLPSVGRGLEKEGGKDGRESEERMKEAGRVGKGWYGGKEDVQGDREERVYGNEGGGGRITSKTAVLDNARRTV